MANTGRISQSAIELLTTLVGQARITQDAIEFMTGVGIDCGSPPAGLVGVAYTHTFPSGGGTPPYTFSISAGSLPSGLTMNASTGAVTGIPTTLGTYAFTVAILDFAGTTSSVSCSIVIGSNQSLSIQLMGWKLYPEALCGEPEEAPELPHVDIAV